MRHPIDPRTLAAFLLLLPSYARAQWASNGVPVTTATTVPSTHAVCADGSGGIVVAWSELRNGQYDIYARRVSAAGVPLWDADGVAVCAAPYDQVAPTICPDDSGGAIVTWRDQRSGNGLDIYAQRITANGLTAWAVDGVGVCTVTNNQYAPVAVSDGAGGAIIAWYDFRSLNYDIFAQRISGNGTLMWNASGVGVCVTQYNQNNPMITTDGAGGAIVAWVDIRNGNADIYARRVDAAGTAQWTPAGNALCTEPHDQIEPILASDEAGGAIVAWRDVRGGTSDVFAQRIDTAGSLLWTANGVTVCTAALDQMHPVITCDAAGGAIVAWDDLRGGVTSDVYAQRINTSGTPQWAANGAAICNATGGQTRPVITPDGASGAILAWEDRRGGASADIYAQRLDGAGVPQWAIDGVAVCVSADDQLAPRSAGDGAGGTVLAWKDSRAGNVDVYANRIGAAGGTPTGVRGPDAGPALAVTQAFPNPFTRSVRFDFGATIHGPVGMEVFDARGRRVAHGEVRGGSLWFDGRDAAGRELPSGVYLFRFTADGTTATRKAVIVR